MPTDNRPVHTDALATLGTLIDETAARDAIHLAVEPMIAGETLTPGADVFVRNGKAYYLGEGEDSPAGIVDPFLSLCSGVDLVPPGAHFWLILMPRTITSLRHVWEHPDFPASAGAPEPKAALTDKEASERWLRDFVARSDCPSYEAVIATAIGEGARQWSEGEYLHFEGVDAHGEIPPEFWDHVEIVTGRTIPQGSRASWFSCGC